MYTHIEKHVNVYSSCFRLWSKSVIVSGDLIKYQSGRNSDNVGEPTQRNLKREFSHIEERHKTY